MVHIPLTSHSYAFAHGVPFSYIVLPILSCYFLSPFSSSSNYLEPHSPETDLSQTPNRKKSSYIWMPKFHPPTTRSVIRFPLLMENHREMAE